MYSLFRINCLTCIAILGRDTQTNVMGQIILMRYELFQNRQVHTHFTSNLTAPQIENYYGDRVRSRLREMCNWIKYKSTSTDKRR